MGKTIGVLGGMGPAATALFYQHLIRLTPARRDQDHLPVIIFSRPQIPDRTRHLLEGGDSPLPLLIDTARRLESAGAELISIPCNTAHVFWKEIQACVRIPVLNIICETAKEIRRSLDLGSRVAIFSTAGTLRTGLYQSALSEVGLEPMEPDTKTQEEIRELIRRIKRRRGCSRVRTNHRLHEQMPPGRRPRYPPRLYGTGCRFQKSGRRSVRF